MLSRQISKAIMPWLAAIIGSEFLRNLRRKGFQIYRRISQRAACAELYLKLDDPHSYLLLEYLDHWLKSTRFALPLRFELYLVEHLPQDCYPEPSLWQSWSVADAQIVAEYLNLDFPPFARTLGDNDSRRRNEFTDFLLNHCPQTISDWRQVFSHYWHQADLPPLVATSARASSIEKHLSSKDRLRQNENRLRRKRQYLSALMIFEGENYWGVARCWHWQQRLYRESFITKHQLPDNPFRAPQTIARDRSDPPLIMYFSARSPYSYLGLMKAIEMCEHSQVELEIRTVRPMLMRGLKVPEIKKWYIFKDTCREAKAAGIPYGRVADPLGRATENCYALFEYALKEDKAVAFMKEFAIAVNAKGIYADNEHGLRIICQNAGLDWQEAKNWLHRSDWQLRCDRNEGELARLGLWGVPCFRYGDQIIWGQDRLCILNKKTPG